MSGRQYTVAIKLVDKDGLLSKLGSVGKGSSTGGVNAAGGGSGIFDKLASLNAGQLLKLTGIGLGIAELVKIGVKSSGILQADFKLWETSMTLIFRPIADFFGLILRPFVLAFLALALPFYKAAGPLFRDYGTQIGNFFKDPNVAITTIAEATIGALALAIAGKLPKIPEANPPPSGGGNFQFPKCIEICDKSPAKFTKPVGDGVSTGIDQSLLVPLLTGIGAELIVINVTQLETKDELRRLEHTLHNRLAVPIPAAAAGRKFNVDIGEKLGVSDSTSVGTASQMDWSKVIASGAGAAVAAGAIEAALARAAGAISSAAGKLEGLAQGIPNSTAFGFAYFGPGGEILPSSTKMRTQMAGMVSALV